MAGRGLGPLRTSLTVPVYSIGTSPTTTLGSLRGPVGERRGGGGAIPGGYVAEKEGPSSTKKCWECQ